MRAARSSLIILLALAGCGGGDSTVPARTDAQDGIQRGGAAVAYGEVLPADERNDQGIFDPSLAFDAGGRGWLAYSSIHDGTFIDTHLAASDDGGASWLYVAAINLSFAGTLDSPHDGHLDGVWRCEVPAIVRDDGDAGAPWKMFLHRYFWNAARDRMADYGWIAMRTAPAPTGPWSEEIALFGAGDFPRPPYDQQRVDLDQLDPALAGNVAYTEPGALVDGGVLYVSLTALHGDGAWSVIIVASDDHGAHWRYAGTAVDRHDAAGYRYHAFDGSSLAAHGGRRLLLVAPVTDAGTSDGTFVIPFADLAHAAVERDGLGRPRLERHIPLQRSILGGLGGGQACYHERFVGGVLMPQFDAAAPPPFRLFATGVLLGEPAAPLGPG